MGDKHKNDEIIKELYAKYDLTPDDVFTKQDKYGRNVQYRIVTRRGIDKIEAKSDAKLTWKHEYVSDNMVVIDIVAELPDGSTFHTNGEADRDNVKQQPVYLGAMALARAKSRAVLGIEGLYKHGFMSVEEADEFKDDEKKHYSKSQGSVVKSGDILEGDPFEQFRKK